MIKYNTLKPGALVKPNCHLRISVDGFNQRWGRSKKMLVYDGFHRLNGARSGIYIGQVSYKKRSFRRFSLSVTQPQGPAVYDEIGYKFLFGGQIFLIQLSHLELVQPAIMGGKILFEEIK